MHSGTIRDGIVRQVRATFLGSPQHWNDEVKSMNMNAASDMRHEGTARKLMARAFKDDDGSWTVKIPELTSSSPSGVTIIATGSASTFRGVRRAASDLASAWLDVDPSEIAVEISVETPDDIVQLPREPGK